MTLISKDIFRFIYIREPRPSAESGSPEFEELICPGLKRASLVNTAEAYREWAESFRKSDQFVQQIHDVSQAFAEFVSWSTQNPEDHFTDELAEQIFGMAVHDLVNNPDFRESVQRILCSYYAVLILEGKPTETGKYLLDAVQAINRLFQSASEHREETDERTNVRRMIVVPAFLARAKRLVVSQKSTPSGNALDPNASKPNEPKNKGDGSNQLTLKDVRDASVELDRLAFSPAASSKTNAKDSGNQTTDQSLKKANEQPSGHCDPLEVTVEQNASTPSDVDDQRTFEFLTSEQIAQLSQSTKNVLKELNLSAEKLPTLEILASIEKQSNRLSQKSPIRNSSRAIPLGNGLIMKTYTPPLVVSSVPQQISKLSTVHWLGRYQLLGIGDLKVVREKLLRYEATDIAHIENILQGESKERVHKRLKRIEETEELESELVESQEKDLQSTDRFELQLESEMQISADLSAEGGATVNASYGPTVGVEAGAAFASGVSTDLATSSASTFVRELTRKTVDRIKKRASEKRRRFVLTEFKEKNSHIVDNSSNPDGHVVGIYQFVDKVICAQTYNLGQRLMLQFMLPQPAKPLLDLAATIAQQKLSAIDIPPTFDISPEDLQPDDYLQYVEKYQASGVNTPPELFTRVSLSYNMDQVIPPGMQDLDDLTKVLNLYIEEGLRWSQSTDIEIPAGYSAKIVRVGLAFPPDILGLEVTTGKFYTNRSFGKVSVNIASYRHHRSFNSWFSKDNFIYQLLPDSSFRGKLPFGITAWETVLGLVVTVTVVCRRTDEALEEWRLETYERLKQAHQAMQLEYEEKLAAAATRQGILSSGRNPAENRRIERDEIKKQVILSMLEDQEINNDNYPELVEFFEYAFEWENMSYKLFPHVWANPTVWGDLQQLKDNDPIHLQFLQAGATRVVLPVRTEYAERVLSRISFGIDAGVLPEEDFADALADLLQNPADDVIGTPEGEPVEVSIPTSLIYLKPDDGLPEVAAQCADLNQ